MLYQYVALSLLPFYMLCTCERSCEIFTDLGLPDAFLGTDLNVRLLLYTRDNQDCGILLSHTNLSSAPLFQPKRPTVFLIHGFRPTGEPPNWLSRAVQLLCAVDDMNIVLVDWNRGATNLNYLTVVRNTKRVAQNLTAFIHMIQESGASLSSIHMIGVSLGAHISGFVGASFNGTIGRITALDPAGPMFNSKDVKERLDSSDARFVDVLHTDVDALGFRNSLGHIDFYPNGGTDQPGCPNTIFSGKSYFQCDHQRSVFLFLSSLNSSCNISTFPCSSYASFQSGACLSCKEFFPLPCPIMGYYVTAWKETLLRLNQTSVFFSTTATEPFCITNYMVELMTWNQNSRWGTISIRLYSGQAVAEATINRRVSEFQRYRDTQLLAQFSSDVSPVDSLSLQYRSGPAVGPRYKLRLLRLRLTALEHPDRLQMCRYDIVLVKDQPQTVRLAPCQDSNF